MQLFNTIQYFDNYLTHPTNSPKPHPLLSLHSSLIHSKLNTSLQTNPILICPLPPTSLRVSTPNTIHHSPLTVCLADSLDLTRCLSILFWISDRELAASRDLAFVSAVEISSLRLRSMLVLFQLQGKKLKSESDEAEEDLFDEVFFDEDLPEDFALIDHGMEDTTSPTLGGLGGKGCDDVLSLRSENDEDEFTTGEAIKERRQSMRSSLIDVMENLKKTKKNVAKNKEVDKVAQSFIHSLIHSYVYFRA